MILRYRSFVNVADLQVDECTIHYCVEGWWNLWFYVEREIDDRPEVFVVPIAPGGPAGDGPGGHTWAFTRMHLGVWQIAPLIKIDRPEGKVWHQAPSIVGVPEGERWASVVSKLSAM